MDKLHVLIAALEAFQSGKIEEAKKLGEDVIESDPDEAVALLMLGNCAALEQRAEDALSYFERSVEAKPDFRDALLALAKIYMMLGRPQDAIASMQKMLDLDQHDVQALLGLAEALQGLSLHDQAKACLKLVHQVDPRNVYAHVLLGRSAWNMNKGVEEAVGHCVRAIEIDPRNIQANNELGLYLLKVGDAAAGCRCFETVINSTGPETAPVFSNLLLSLHYRCDVSASDLFQRHLSWEVRHGITTCVDRLDFDNEPDASRRLRVGFLSPDLYGHSVFYFLSALFSAYRKEELEFICFADRQEAADDKRTLKLKSMVDGWHYVHGFSPHKVCELVAEQKIDVLFDLTGHTGKNRLVVFSRRAAPVQVTWLGYPDTTGVANMDYRIVDDVTDPAPWADELASEKLYRLPETFICYQPADDVPDVPVKTHLTEGKIVFGTFNEASKFSPSVLRLWCEILNRIPEAELVFKCRPFGEEKTKEYMFSVFQKYGVDESRVRLLAFIQSADGHMGTYNEIDIALDPFPYNGTTTSFEALWMGVPFITREGDRHCARVGMSMLKSVGLEEFIADSDEAYVQKAVDIAADRDRLLAIKLGLRERMRKSALCDNARFAGHFGDALRDMWQQWCEDKNRVG